MDVFCMFLLYFFSGKLLVNFVGNPISFEIKYV